MKKMVRILALAGAICLAVALCMPVSALEVPNPERLGSVTVNMRYNNEPVPGGSLTLFRVGKIVEDDGNYSFALDGAFADSGVVLEDVTSQVTAKALADFAAEKKLEGVTKSVDDQGYVRFDGVEPGLYLVVQTDPAKGFEVAQPFMVGLPAPKDGGGYEYDVDASPKVSLEQAPTEPTVTTPTGPTSPTLPQTGQMNWPVPVLVVTGLVLIACGWMLFMSKKEKK